MRPQRAATLVGAAEAMMEGSFEFEGSVRTSAVRRENSGRLCDSRYDPRLTSAQAHELLEHGVNPQVPELSALARSEPR
jgi:hypothetical protein